MRNISLFLSGLLISFLILAGCNTDNAAKVSPEKETMTAKIDTPVYFNLRPKLEKEYGYTHAVQIGDDLKISGAVSMDDAGTLLAPGSMEQQMKNCYSDLEKILQTALLAANNRSEELAKQLAESS